MGRLGEAEPGGMGRDWGGPIHTHPTAVHTPIFHPAPSYPSWLCSFHGPSPTKVGGYN